VNLVESYSFGRIRISGKEYSRDVVVAPDAILDEQWWRREGHALYVEDISRYVESYRPRVVVVGTGYYGVMKVSREVEAYLREKGIELVALDTRRAVEEYNKRAGRGERVLGAFHLTC
jgi:hypothetical protein